MAYPVDGALNWSDDLKGYIDTGDAASGTVAADLAAHIADPSGAHAASAISYAGSAGLSATDVEAALDELDSEKASTGSVTTVSSGLADHIADASDAHDASAISYAGATGLSATDVEAALDELDAEKVSITRTINAQTGTTYTLVLGDAGKFVTMSNGSASTLTVPPNSSVAFPVGATIEGAQLGAGQVTLTPGSGVTINATPGLKIAAQYGSYALIKIATDTWLAFGRLAA